MYSLYYKLIAIEIAPNFYIYFFTQYNRYLPILWLRWNYSETRKTKVIKFEFSFILNSFIELILFRVCKGSLA